MLPTISSTLSSSSYVGRVSAKASLSVNSSASSSMRVDSRPVEKPRTGKLATDVNGSCSSPSAQEHEHRQEKDGTVGDPSALSFPSAIESGDGARTVRSTGTRRACVANPLVTATSAAPRRARATAKSVDRLATLSGAPAERAEAVVRVPRDTDGSAPAEAPRKRSCPSLSPFSLSLSSRDDAAWSLDGSARANAIDAGADSVSPPPVASSPSAGLTASATANTFSCPSAANTASLVMLGTDSLPAAPPLATRRPQNLSRTTAAGSSGSSAADAERPAVAEPRAAPPSRPSSAGGCQRRTGYVLLAALPPALSPIAQSASDARAPNATSPVHASPTACTQSRRVLSASSSWRQPSSSADPASRGWEVQSSGAHTAAAGSACSHVGSASFTHAPALSHTHCLQEPVAPRRSNDSCASDALRHDCTPDAFTAAVAAMDRPASRKGDDAATPSDDSSSSSAISNLADFGSDADAGSAAGHTAERTATPSRLVDTQPPVASMVTSSPLTRNGAAMQVDVNSSPRSHDSALPARVNSTCSSSISAQLRASTQGAMEALSPPAAESAARPSSAHHAEERLPTVQSRRASYSFNGSAVLTPADTAAQPQQQQQQQHRRGSNEWPGSAVAAAAALYKASPPPPTTAVASLPHSPISHHALAAFPTISIEAESAGLAAGELPALRGCGRPSSSGSAKLFTSANLGTAPGALPPRSVPSRVSLDDDSRCGSGSGHSRAPASSAICANADGNTTTTALSSSASASASSPRMNSARIAARVPEAMPSKGARARGDGADGPLHIGAGNSITSSEVDSILSNGRTGSAAAEDALPHPLANTPSLPQLFQRHQQQQYATRCSPCPGSGTGSGAPRTHSGSSPSSSTFVAAAAAAVAPLNAARLSSSLHSDSPPQIRRSSRESIDLQPSSLITLVRGASDEGDLDRAEVLGRPKSSSMCFYTPEREVGATPSDGMARAGSFARAIAILPESTSIIAGSSPSSSLCSTRIPPQQQQQQQNRSPHAPNVAAVSRHLRPFQPVSSAAAAVAAPSSALCASTPPLASRPSPSPLTATTPQQQQQQQQAQLPPPPPSLPGVAHRRTESGRSVTFLSASGSSPGPGASEFSLSADIASAGGAAGLATFAAPPRYVGIASAHHATLSSRSNGGHPSSESSLCTGSRALGAASLTGAPVTPASPLGNDSLPAHQPHATVTSSVSASSMGAFMARSISGYAGHGMPDKSFTSLAAGSTNSSRAQHRCRAGSSSPGGAVSDSLAASVLPGSSVDAPGAGHPSATVPAVSSRATAKERTRRTAAAAAAGAGRSDTLVVLAMTNGEHVLTRAPRPPSSLFSDYDDEYDEDGENAWDEEEMSELSPGHPAARTQPRSRRHARAVARPVGDRHWRHHAYFMDYTENEGKRTAVRRPPRGAAAPRGSSAVLEPVEIAVDDLTVLEEIDGNSTSASSYASSSYRSLSPVTAHRPHSASARAQRQSDPYHSHAAPAPARVNSSPAAAADDPALSQQGQTSSSHVPSHFANYYLYSAATGRRVGRRKCRLLRWHHTRQPRCPAATADTLRQPSLSTPRALPAPAASVCPSSSILFYNDVDAAALDDVENRLRGYLGLKQCASARHVDARAADVSVASMAATLDLARKDQSPVLEPRAGGAGGKKDEPRTPLQLLLPTVMSATATTPDGRPSDTADGSASCAPLESLFRILDVPAELRVLSGFHVSDYYARCPTCDPTAVLPISSSSIAHGRSKRDRLLRRSRGSAAHAASQRTRRQTTAFCNDDDDNAALSTNFFCQKMALSGGSPSLLDGDDDETDGGSDGSDWLTDADAQRHGGGAAGSNGSSALLVESGFDDSSILTSDAYSCCSCSFCRLKCASATPARQAEKTTARDGVGSVAAKSPARTESARAASAASSRAASASLRARGRCVCPCAACQTHQHEEQQRQQRETRGKRRDSNESESVNAGAQEPQPAARHAVNALSGSTADASGGGDTAVEQRRARNKTGAPHRRRAAAAADPVAMPNVLCIDLGGGEHFYVNPRTATGGARLLADAALRQQQCRADAEAAALASARSTHSRSRSRSRGRTPGRRQRSRRHRQHHRGGWALVDLPEPHRSARAGVSAAAAAGVATTWPPQSAPAELSPLQNDTSVAVAPAVCPHGHCHCTSPQPARAAAADTSAPPLLPPSAVAAAANGGGAARGGGAPSVATVPPPPPPATAARSAAPRQARGVLGSRERTAPTKSPRGPRPTATFAGPRAGATPATTECTRPDSTTTPMTPMTTTATPTAATKGSPTHTEKAKSSRKRSTGSGSGGGGGGSGVFALPVFGRTPSGPPSQQPA